MVTKNEHVSENYEWYVSADTKRYAGKWIAIVDQKVVASGEDAEKVYRKARSRYPRKKLSIAKVPGKEILVLPIGS
jgi:transposase